MVRLAENPASGKRVTTGMERSGQIVTDLVEFIDRAEQIGNYPTNTAGGIKAAIRLVSKVLTEEEATSVDTFREHLEQIFQRVFNKNKKISPTSLQAYRARINTVLTDFEQYGQSPTAMATWQRKKRVFTPRRQSNSNNGGDGSQGGGELSIESTASLMSRHEMPLRPNVKAILLLPVDLRDSEARRLKTLIDACVTSAE